MEARYHYAGTCIESTCERITDMIEHARPVTLRTLRKHCVGLRDWERDMGYAVGAGKKGLRLKNDWAVSFHKSRYDGRPCYFIDHSRIERIWTRRP